MAGLDPATEAAVELSVAQDEEFTSMVQKVAKKALATQLRFLQHGTPEQQMNAARGFMPIFARVLAKEEQDVNAVMHEDVRRIISSVIVRKPKKEVEDNGEG